MMGGICWHWAKENRIFDSGKTAKECGAQWLVIEQDDHSYGTPMGDMKKEP